MLVARCIRSSGEFSPRPQKHSLGQKGISVGQTKHSPGWREFSLVARCVSVAGVRSPLSEGSFPWPAEQLGETACPCRVLARDGLRASFRNALLSEGQSLRIGTADQKTGRCKKRTKPIAALCAKACLMYRASSGTPHHASPCRLPAHAHARGQRIHPQDRPASAFQRCTLPRSRGRSDALP